MNEGAILKRLGLSAKTSKVRGGNETGNKAVLLDGDGKVRYKAVDKNRTQDELVTELVEKALKDSNVDPTSFLPAREQAQVKIDKMQKQLDAHETELTALGARLTQLCEAMNAKATEPDAPDRKRLMQILDEKGVDYPKNISNEKLQALAAEHVATPAANN